MDITAAVRCMMAKNKRPIINPMILCLCLCVVDAVGWCLLGMWTKISYVDYHAYEKIWHIARENSHIEFGISA